MHRTQPPAVHEVPVCWGNAGVTKTYYSAGSQLIAMRQFTSPTTSMLRAAFLHGDHLGSTSLTTDNIGNVVARQLYDAWGNVRLRGDLKTDIGYTSQREEVGINLMFYRARYFSPSLGRFLSADTIVPDGKNPQAWNRYSYTANNPLKYIDPSGHCWGIFSFLRDVPLYSQICPTTDLAWKVVTDGNAPLPERFLASIYVTAFGGSQAMLAAGTAGAACGSVAPCAAAVGAASADGNPANELEAAVNIVQRTGNSVWKLNPLERGVQVESMVGRSPNLLQNFPTIDRFVNGVATSIKSLDLTAKTYQNISALGRTVKGYIDTMAGYQGQTTPWGDVTIFPYEITARAVDLAIPAIGASPVQLAELAKWQQYAQSIGVTLNIIQLP